MRVQDKTRKFTTRERLARIVIALSAMLAGGALGAFLDKLVVSMPPAPPESVQAPPENPPAFEASDLDSRQLLKLGIGFVIALALVLLVTTLLQYGWMGYVAPFAAQAPNLNPPPQVTLPAEPRVEAIPGITYDQLYPREREQLDSYGWVNQSAGVVHIPIERAMDLLLRRGLPVAPQDAQNNFDTMGNELPSSSSSGRVMEKVYP